MTDVRPGGNRRIDRVLAPTYLDGLETLPIDVVRAKRQEAEQEDVDLSYLRRLLHGRIDIVRAEQARRAAAVDGSVVDERPRILTEPADVLDARGVTAEGAGSRHGRARSFGRMRHFVAEPSRTELRRRRVERLVADVDLADVAARTDDELERVLRTYQTEERQVSEVRARVQQVLDRCGAELARRYSDGEASVAEVLEAGGTAEPDASSGPAAGPGPAESRAAGSEAAGSEAAGSEAAGSGPAGSGAADDGGATPARRDGLALAGGDAAQPFVAEDADEKRPAADAARGARSRDGRGGERA